MKLPLLALLGLTAASTLAAASPTTKLDKLQTEIHESAATAHPPRVSDAIKVVEVNDLHLKNVPKHENKPNSEKKPKVAPPQSTPAPPPSAAPPSIVPIENKPVVDEKAVVDKKPTDEQDEEFDLVPIVLLRGRNGGLFLFQPFQDGVAETNITDETATDGSVDKVNTVEGDNTVDTIDENIENVDANTENVDENAGEEKVGEEVEGDDEGEEGDKEGDDEEGDKEGDDEEASEEESSTEDSSSSLSSSSSDTTE